MKKLLSLLCLAFIFSCDNDSSDFSPDLSGTGTGGSLAKFTIINNQVLVLNQNEVKQYDIRASGELIYKSQISIGGQLETIFPYGTESVLIGSSDAVYFLGFDANNTLTLKSTYAHLTACDPVVAKDGIAFSTLKISDCRNGTDDFIEAIDISDIENPKVLRVYNTTAPFGLAINNSFLFICEKGGLTMYSYNEEGDITAIDFKEIPNAIPLDLIISDRNLIIRTDDGFYNMSYGDTGLGDVLGSVTTN